MFYPTCLLVFFFFWLIFFGAGCMMFQLVIQNYMGIVALEEISGNTMSFYYDDRILIRVHTLLF